MDDFWRTLARSLRPLPSLTRVTLEHGVCFEETLCELLSKFPSTARIHLIGARDAVWQSYARQIPANVTHLTLPDVGNDLGMLARFAGLTSIDLESPTLALCKNLANLHQRTALTRLGSTQGIEQATLGLLSNFPRLSILSGLSLREPLDVEQVTQWCFPALRSLAVFVGCETGVADLRALLSALPALRCLYVWLQDSMLSDMDALLDAALPRLGELCVYRVAKSSGVDKAAADAAWKLLQRRVLSDPWLDGEAR